MSEATVFQGTIPDGWYDDPARPDMERWWSGTEWSEHVRYADRVRPRAVSAVPLIAPSESSVDAFVPLFPAPAPFSQSFASPAPTLAPIFEAPPQIGAVPAFDDFYVPMGRFEPGADARLELARRRRSARVAILWIVTLAVVGAGVGVALWAFLPQN